MEEHVDVGNKVPEITSHRPNSMECGSLKHAVCVEIRSLPRQNSILNLQLRNVILKSLEFKYVARSPKFGIGATTPNILGIFW